MQVNFKGYLLILLWGKPSRKRKCLYIKTTNRWCIALTFVILLNRTSVCKVSLLETKPNFPEILNNPPKHCLYYFTEFSTDVIHFIWNHLKFCETLGQNCLIWRLISCLFSCVRVSCVFCFLFQTEFPFAVN